MTCSDVSLTLSRSDVSFTVPISYAPLTVTCSDDSLTVTYNDVSLTVISSDAPLTVTCSSKTHHLFGENTEKSTSRCSLDTISVRYSNIFPIRFADNFCISNCFLIIIWILNLIESRADLHLGQKCRSICIKSFRLFFILYCLNK